MAIPRRKTVQIVGAAPSINSDPIIEGAERWLFNASYLLDQGRPYTRIFNLHDAEMARAVQPAAWAWYAQQACPVYLIEPVPELSQSVRFPIEQIQAAFANETRDGLFEQECCFGCSVDYLIAFALLEGFEQIDLMGIECRSEEEYREQRSSVMYWMGRGRGMGRAVTCSAGSGLCMMPAMYGYNTKTGAPLPPGQSKGRWERGNPYSTWPPPADYQDPFVVVRDPIRYVTAMHDEAR